MKEKYCFTYSFHIFAPQMVFVEPVNLGNAVEQK